MFMRVSVDMLNTDVFEVLVALVRGEGLRLRVGLFVCSCWSMRVKMGSIIVRKRILKVR